VQALADVAAAVAAARGVPAPCAGRARAARRPSPRRCCPASARPCCWATPRAASAGLALLALAHWIAAQTGASVGYLGEAATASARSWWARCPARAA
jgi:NADH-quinone oxidoreductase subunit G